MHLEVKTRSSWGSDTVPGVVYSARGARPNVLLYTYMRGHDNTRSDFLWHLQPSVGKGTTVRYLDDAMMRIRSSCLFFSTGKSNVANLIFSKTHPQKNPGGP